MARGSNANNTALLDEVEPIYAIRFWWSIIIIPVGIVGNILCLLVVSQKQNRSISCSVYMGALAVADMFVLIGRSLLMYVVYGTSKYSLNTSTMICKAIGFMFFTSSQSGSMIILAMLLERVIAVTKPLKAAVLLSPKRALLISLMIPTVLSIFNIPHIIYTFSYKTRRIMTMSMECMNVDGIFLTSKIYSIVTLFISGILPLFGILIMNLIILFAVKSSKFSWRKRLHKRGLTNSQRLRTSEEKTRSTTLAASTSSVQAMFSLSSTSVATDNVELGISTISAMSPSTDIREKQVNNQQNKDKKRKEMNQRDRQLTVMTVVMTLTFLMCVPPYYLRSLVYNLLDPPRNIPANLIRFWITSVFANLMTLNSAINFFLCVMTGSKFRADLMRMFHLSSTTE